MKCTANPALIQDCGVVTTYPEDGLKCVNGQFFASRDWVKKNIQRLSKAESNITIRGPITNYPIEVEFINENPFHG